MVLKTEKKQSKKKNTKKAETKKAENKKNKIKKLKTKTSITKNLSNNRLLNNNNDIELLSSLKDKGDKYFLPQARLNKGQRGFCHCIMKNRINQKSKKRQNPYTKCRTLSIIKGSNHARTLKKGEYNQWFVNFKKTNCVMNYKYSDYSMKEIQAFCQEKKIPITYINNEGKKIYFKKNKLIESLIKHYTKRNQNKKK
jgi:hypothetical protein